MAQRDEMRYTSVLPVKSKARPKVDRLSVWLDRRVLSEFFFRPTLSNSLGCSRCARRLRPDSFLIPLSKRSAKFRRRLPSPLHRNVVLPFPSRHRSWSNISVEVLVNSCGASRRFVLRSIVSFSKRNNTLPLPLCRQSKFESLLAV